MRRPLMIAVVLAAVTALTSTHPASAEWRFDVFAGMSVTPDTWLELDSRLTALGNQRLRGNEEVHLKTSGNVGGRLGYWFESPKWLGAALDVMHYRPDLAAQPGGALARAQLVTGLREIEGEVTAVSLDVILRLPHYFPSPEMPGGHLQPYLTLGPTGNFIRIEDRGNLVPKEQSQVGLLPGFKFGAGFSWMVTKKVGLFAEYRLTRFTLDFDDTEFQRGSFGGVPATAEGHMNILTNHAVFGFTFPF